MKQDFLHDAEKYKEKHQRKKRWYKVVTCLAAFVVFCTTYALILPAITLEKGECDIQEHTHTDACYEPAETVTKRILVCNEENLNLHKHTEDCYNENEELICGYADFVVHQHDDSCYDENGTLCCLLREIKAHTHDKSCYTTEKEPSLICEEEEIILHEHTEDCFDENRNLICGKTQVLEHVHTDDCFESVEETVGTPTLICGMEEHVHSEACSPEQEMNIPEDSAEDNTVPETGEIVHTEEEHSGSDVCISETETSQMEMTFTGSDYTVQVRYGTDARLPEGVTLQVAEIPADSEEYQTYLAETAATVESGKGNSILFARFFDITFLLNGEKVEPVAPVEVTITYDDNVVNGEDVNYQTVHFGKEGVETLDTITEITSEGGTSFRHKQNDFSVTGNVVTRAGNSTDIGENSLPVDYYVCIDGEWQNVGSTKTGWYSDENAVELTDYNRDYITVEQAVSVLGPYGFQGEEANPSLVFAYQQKSGNTKLYSDTNTVAIEGKNVLPLSRNADHQGYNLYYLPKNTGHLSNVASPENLDKSANGFYTIKVYDHLGKLLDSQIVLSGSDYTYDASAVNVAKWLAVMGNSTQIFSDSTIHLQNITSPVRITPKEEGEEGSGKVTFKVMVDGKWKNIGFLPYYFKDEQGRAYITSVMAAGFFGDYGYTAGTESGVHFGYSYDDIYKIYYASNMNYCMDIDGNKIENNTKVHLWTSNKSTAQIFRIWNSGEGYSYITPVENSAYHINVLGGGTADGAKLGIHTATDAASQWRVVTNSGGTTSFYNRNAPDTACIDLTNGTVQNGNQLQIWANATNRYWKLVQQYRISNAVISTNNDDGTYNIYLTPESNGDIVCYYLPAETVDNYVNAAESAISMDNSFWSVSVRDDTHTVYSASELDNMVQYIGTGGEAEVTVQNAAGILWSCVGGGSSVEITETQKDGFTNFVIRNITQPVEVTATKANPAFTVQYYAVIPRYATSGNNPLTVIDTSGGILPVNGGSMAKKSLYLEGTGQKTNQNAGQATELYRVSTKMELTKMYSDESFQYVAAPGLEYFNKLKDNENYQLTQVGVLKEGKDLDSQNDDDWTWYKLEDGVSFTNVASEANENTILLSEDTVLRLWFETTSSDYYNGTTFYDYNISSGQNSDGKWRTGITGINIKANYGTSLNNERTWDSYKDVFAFGNANCGTGMSGYLFDGGTLNKYNSKNSDYMGCTFGLVQGLNGDGTLKYNEWIVAPKLFNEGDAQYKQTYSGSSLNFERVGDTYTLSAATLANSNGNSNTINNLQYFFNPSPASGTTHTHIFTNNFWPMDQAAGKTDGLWGAYGNTGSFQGFTESSTGSWSNLASNFPPGDDGRAHNWFFGMNFALSFNLTEDYVGPLEYTFFGDDDLWVFLDGKLICDIGGVHSSIGEFVNLRDYLPEGSSGQHTLSFFYTERGASGSTCYMQFTLPSVSSATTSRDTGSLQISKALSADSDLEAYKDVDYEFKVELLTGENGSPLNGTYSYGLCSDDDSEVTYGTVKSGGTIKLKAGQIATISGIPAGTFYRVTELTTEGYLTTVNNATGYITSGTIENGGTSPAAFVNRPYTELPATGGKGTTPYTVGGILLIMTATILLLYNKKKYGKERSASS